MNPHVCLTQRLLSNSSHEKFKTILPLNDICPGCKEVYNKLRDNAAVSCLKDLTNFTRFLSSILQQRKTASN